jgi:putative flippase GtrA
VIRPVIRQVIRFGIVGAVGFIVDVVVLLLLVKLELLTPLPGRFVSFLIAASATYFLNARFTFRAGNRFSIRRWTYYVAATMFGAVLNVGTYQAWILHNGSSAVQLALGAALGSLAAMIVNYTVSALWVFRSAQPATVD